MATASDFTDFLIVDQREIDEKYTCSVCRSLFDKPHKIDKCGHIFCQVCLYNSFAQTKKCPICRQGYDYKKIEFEKRLNLKMKELKYTCNACDSKVYLCHLNNHRLNCTDDSSADCSYMSHIKNKKENKIPNRYTFICPFCNLPNLDQVSLIDHCNELHANDDQSKVCPICKVMPWGDPQLVSSNFLHHLNVRHKFEYENFVDFNEDESVSLRKVLAKSAHQS